MMGDEVERDCREVCLAFYYTSFAIFLPHHFIKCPGIQVEQEMRRKWIEHTLSTLSILKYLESTEGRSTS